MFFITSQPNAHGMASRQAEDAARNRGETDAVWVGTCHQTLSEFLPSHLPCSTADPVFEHYTFTYAKYVTWTF